MYKTTRAYVKILEIIIGTTTSRCERKAKEMRIYAKDDNLRESGTPQRFRKDLMRIKQYRKGGRTFQICLEIHTFGNDIFYFRIYYYFY